MLWQDVWPGLFINYLQTWILLNRIFSDSHLGPFSTSREGIILRSLSPTPFFKREEDSGSDFNQKNFSEFYSGVYVLSFVVRNSGGTKCQEIGVMPRCSAAGIVNFQEFLYYSYANIEKLLHFLQNSTNLNIDKYTVIYYSSP